MNHPLSVSPTVVDPDDLDKNLDGAAPHLSELVSQRVARRHFLRSGVGAMASVGLGTLSLSACGGGEGGEAGSAGRATAQALPVQANPNARWRADTLDFDAVGKSIADSIVVPEGYVATIVHATGDSIDPNVPDYTGDGKEGTYSRRVGDHHDGMNFFPLAAQQDRPDANGNRRGILAVNHENITGTAQFLHPLGETNVSGGGPRPADEVIKEQEAHGVSLTEVRRAADGSFAVAKGSRYNRRITARTEVDIAGPVTGTHWVKTKYSPSGTRARGTLNNCGHGVTPWGTYLAAEENWAGYFKRNAGDDALRPVRENTQLLRNGMRPNSEGFAHRRWASVEATGLAASDFERWNISVLAGSPTDDYRNEHNTFGYVVEIDPYAPLARPKKRTAMGRRANEGAWSSLPKAGRPIAFYIGCDSQNEYVYKYVSAAAWSPSDAFGGLAAGDKYLDRGTIYAAVFEADGTGRWEPLTLANPKVAAGVPVSSYNPQGYSFESLADICVNTRLAAGAAGATRMDRPEWTAVNPFTGEIYITMTENPNRGNAGLSGNNVPNPPLDAANPRYCVDPKAATSQGAAAPNQRGNVNGHIVRIREDGDDAAALSFRWDIFLFGAQAHKDAGIPDSTYTDAFYQANVNLSGLSDANDLSKPDGCWFSKTTGILYIQTDDNTFTDQTNAQLLACIPGTLGDGGPVVIENLASGSPDAAVRSAGGSVKQATQMGRRLSDATFKRMLVGPRGAEITGLTETPDGRTLFVNVQHPGENTGRSGAVPASVALTPATPSGPFESNFPGNLGYGPGGMTARPRSATIAISRKDGGVIGFDPDKPNKGGRA
jgi:secreted PhoX family phosphatase